MPVDLKLTLDPSHFIVQGYEITDWESLIRSTTHTHIRSCGTNEKELQIDTNRCSDKVFKSIETMLRFGFKGTYCFEMIEGFADTDTDAKTETMKLLDLIVSGN